MEGIKPPRPLTHDLIKNIITSFGAELSDIIIDELRDGTFYAKLNIDSQLIDSRPSDAIALDGLAWAMNMPMTRAIEEVFDYLPKIVDKKRVCAGCRDKTKCQGCAFNPN